MAEFDSKSDSGNIRNRDADQTSRSSSNADGTGVVKDSRNTSASSRRATSTADNPWGLSRT
ncbi:hypothetical protein N9383_02955 [Granulosicoccus sp.]|nr:hypothetical protein [Granulosicoccus sp.]